MAVSTSEDSDVLSEINITPLVDVMLVLLVAFVITIPALTNAIHVNLPRTVNTTPPDEQKAITITVDNAGIVYFDDQPVAADAIAQRLANIKAAVADPTLHLRADDRVPYGRWRKSPKSAPESPGLRYSQTTSDVLFTPPSLPGGGSSRVSNSSFSLTTIGN
jgi:biopolymer transport protein ExbD